MKNCKYCGEEIQNEAKKCRYCGEWIEKKENVEKLDIKENVESKSNEKIKTGIKGDELIKVAFGFSLITIGLSTVLYLIDVGNGTENYGISILDILIFCVLSFGLYKKSRVAAIGIFCYFILGKISQILDGSIGSGIIRGIIFGIAYFKGILGSFQYHKILKTQKLHIWEIVLSILIGIILILATIGLLA